MSTQTLDAVRNVDGDSFATLVLQAPGPVAVEFMSYSCAHCGALEPALQQLAQRLQSQVAIFRLNVAVEPELAASYEIQGTPTLIMFTGGREVGRTEGPGPSVAALQRVVMQAFQD